VFAETYPDAEIMLMGVEEPKCLIHAPNESVDPSEIENMALSEALFLEKYAQAEAAR
jgi:cysteinylglycine-S-conjugate dipeptidase